MNIQELLTCQLKEKEICYSVLANSILNAFNGSYKPHCFGNVVFHSEPSNDPNGYRIVYVEGEGFTLLQGNGDKGLGWIIDGENCYENVNNYFYANKINKSKEYNKDEIGFIPSFENFLDYTLTKVFHSNFSSKNVFENNVVKRVLDFNSDI